MPNLTCNYNSHSKWNYSTKILTKKRLKKNFCKSPFPLSQYTQQVTCRELPITFSAGINVLLGRVYLPSGEKMSDVNLTPYHLHITEDFSYYHLHSSPPSPPMESKGIPAILRICLGLFKQRSIAMSFSPIFGPWLLIFIASYFVRESLSWCYAKNLWSWFGNPTESLGYYFYICPIHILPWFYVIIIFFLMVV